MGQIRATENGADPLLLAVLKKTGVIDARP